MGSVMNPLEFPLVIYMRALLADRVMRARTAPSRGASAVEWVIITAIIAGVALTLATLIQSLVTSKSSEIQSKFGGGGGGGAPGPQAT
jgi:Flp pilus assembly pilin Flp